MSQFPVSASHTDPQNDHAAIVRGLYRGFLGRDPDPDGLLHWTTRLAGGEGANAILASLMASTEYRQRYGAGAALATLKQRVVAAAATLLVRPLTVVDIGAQELAEEGHVYAPLTDSTLACRIIGFEPQEEKIAASQQRLDARVTLFPTFIGDGAGHTFHLNNVDATSSLLPLNHALTDQLVDLSHLRTVQTEDVATSRLDDVLGGVGQVDFLKLDIQGFELPVLQHAAHTLARTQVVHCEIGFAPIYAGQALFSEIEMLLRAAGFYLLDFHSLCRYQHIGTACATRDRLGWGDAVFFRESSLLTDPAALLAQCLVALLVYDKPSTAAALAQRYDAATGAHLAALFEQEAA
jgi:FkbM family methyltransferase